MSERRPPTPLIDEVSGPALMDDTRAIARWVRLSGEPDELASFEWAKKRIEEIGLVAELQFHDAYISLPGPARLTVAGKNIDCITHSFAASTDAGGLRGELVDGDADPASGSGKVVLLDGMANGVTATTWSQRGSLAQIHVQDDHLHESAVSRVWGSPTDLTMPGMPNTPSISVRRADGAWLREQLARGRVTVDIHAEVTSEWRKIPILIADMPNVDAESFVLFTSHIDSWHYGAMDNGSANATALEVVRRLYPHRRTFRRGLRLVFWSGHSHGRFAGSAWLVDRYYQELHEHCVANVFVDSTGGKDATIVTEPPVMPQTWRLAADAVEGVTGETFVGKRIGRFADQSFYGVGINSVFGTLSEQDAEKTKGGISFKTGGKRAGGLGWWWHTPDDTVDKVDETNLVRDTKIYLEVVHRLLTDPVLPFDYAPAVDEVITALNEIEAASGGHVGFGDVIADARALAERMPAWNAFLAEATASPELAPIADSGQIRLARHLVPIAFHENEPFDHDPMEPLVALPALRPSARLSELADEPTQFHPLRTRMVRRANWIDHELRAARRAIDETLRAHAPSSRGGA